MRKIPTLFVRDPENRSRVLPEVMEGCEWVLAGEGRATRKYDGTCVMMDRIGRWFARREVKPGAQPPEGFVAVMVDATTGKTMGWEPITRSPFARYHAEAVDAMRNVAFQPGTYELLGPKIQGNPEGWPEHFLMAHDNAPTIPDVALTFDGIASALIELAGAGVEGIVWHHPDGRMAKIKCKDFGIRVRKMPVLETTA